jgi:hypothetical protein
MSEREESSKKKSGKYAIYERKKERTPAYNPGYHHINRNNPT